MNPDVAALLEVQADDMRVYGLEDRLQALAPHLAALEQDRKRAEESFKQGKLQVEAEEQRQRELQDRLRQHREHRDKSEALLGQVTTPREAAAAMAQIEQAKRFIADEERDLEAMQHRLVELRRLVTERDTAVKEIERVQQDTRTSLDADRAAIEKELGEVRAERNKKAEAVPRQLLHRYDRIRSKRRTTALYPLRGQSCAHCDTAIPVQRHSTMAATGATEMCEGCGVLLYSAE
ncbi:MAG: zinc ribbon domain-containing protein [Gemmatimonadaceae bacterium]